MLPALLFVYAVIGSPVII